MGRCLSLRNLCLRQTLASFGRYKNLLGYSVNDMVRNRSLDYGITWEEHLFLAPHSFHKALQVVFHIVHDNKYLVHIRADDNLPHGNNVGMLALQQIE